MNSSHSLGVAALLVLAACAGQNETTMAASASELTEPGSEWAKCWSAPGVDADSRDIVCVRGGATTPVFLQVTAQVGGQLSTLAGTTAPTVVRTLHGGDPLTVTLSFVGRRDSDDGMGLGVTLRTTVDVSAATVDAPIVVAPAFETWRVTVHAEAGAAFSMSLQPYEVGTGAFTTDPSPFLVEPPDRPTAAGTKQLTLAVPRRGAIQGRLLLPGGATPTFRLDAPGDYVATREGLVRSDASARPDAGATSVLPSCGGDRQDGCCQGGGCECDAWTILTIFGCQACGSDGERACKGDRCKPGLAADAQHTCR